MMGWLCLAVGLSSLRVLGFFTDPLLSARQIHQVIGEPALCRWYARALKGQGRLVSVHNGDEAARAGLFALQQEMAA